MLYSHEANGLEGPLNTHLLSRWLLLLYEDNVGLLLRLLNYQLRLTTFFGRGRAKPQRS